MGTKKITVTALTSGATDPSTRFRIRQYIEPLAVRDIEVHEFCPVIDKYTPVPAGLAKLGVASKAMLLSLKLASRFPGLINSYRTDIVWMNRELIPGCKSIEHLVGGVRVFDIDDAVWVGSARFEKRIIKILQSVDVVLAGNSYLADWCSSHCSSAYIIPTGIDTHRFIPSEKRGGGEEFVIGWTGTRHTLKYLYEIASALKVIFDRFDNAILLVISDVKPDVDFLEGCRIRWVKWSPEIEAVAIHQMDVGIMPLPDDDWAMGKCSFKMLQYMSSGIPTVVSPVGMNGTVLSLGEVGYGATTIDEWVQVLSTLRADQDLCQRLGRAGRELAESMFSIDVVSNQIETIFKKIAS